MYKKHPNLICFFLISFCLFKVEAQNSIFKYIPAYNSDITREKIFDFNIYSYGVAFERVIGQHSSLEAVLLRARTVGRIGIETKKLNGIATELRYRYYFQTNGNFVTFAPFEFYVAPSVGYSQVQTKTLNDFHEIKNFNVGALVGYQFIMELYEEGFSVDINAGFNVNFPKIQGTLDNLKDNALTPRLGLSFGYTY